MASKIKILVLILCLCLALVFFGKGKDEKVSTDTTIKEAKLEDVFTDKLLLSDIKIYQKDKDYVFNANVTNLTANTLDMGFINIKAGDILLKGYIGEIEPNEKRNLNIQTNESLNGVNKVSISQE